MNTFPVGSIRMAIQGVVFITGRLSLMTVAVILNLLEGGADNG